MQKIEKKNKKEEIGDKLNYVKVKRKIGEENVI
jgi:hypothetical protein